MELRRLYDQLAWVVLHAEVVFSKLQLSEARSPERLELIVVFEQTNAILTALADFLDGLDRELASEGTDRLQARPSLDETRAFAREIEALENKELLASLSPRLPWKHGVLARLYDFYSFHVRLENHFHTQRIPRAFAWQQSLELWQAFVYCGGISASGGLLSRLQFLWDLPELREGHRSEAASRDDAEEMADDLRSGLITSFHREQGFGVITLDDGLNVQFDSSNCTMVPEEGAAVRLRIGTARRDGRIKALHVEPAFVPALSPKQVSRLWGDRDIRVLRSIAQHAEFLATADEEAFLEYARRE